MRKVVAGLVATLLLLLLQQGTSHARWRAFSDFAVDVDDQGVPIDGDPPEVCEEGIRFTAASLIRQPGEQPPTARSIRGPDLLAVTPPQGPLPGGLDPTSPEGIAILTRFFGDPPGTRLIERTPLVLPLNPIITQQEPGFEGIPRWYSQEFFFRWSSPQPPGTQVELIFDIGDLGANLTFDQRLVTTVQDCAPDQPQSKDHCKNGGWRTLVDDRGRPFRNQGQCVSYVNHRR
jgi:hypothetical protein